MNEKINEIKDEIKYLERKCNSYDKLLVIANSFEKKIVRRQIKLLTTYIQSRKTEIRRIKNESILNGIANQIERKGLDLKIE